MAYNIPHHLSVVSHAFNSVGSGTNSIYIGGYYEHGAAADDFNPVINFGTANAAYGAHVGFVCAASPGGDTSITVAGTSITDAGVRTGGDSEVVTFLDADPVNTYRETAKKWIGLVTITKTAGNDRLCNYLWAKYWDHDNHDFILQGFEFTWFGNGNDSNADIIIYHHKATGWTYNAGAEAGPPVLYSMQTDYGTEHAVVNNQPGAYKRTLLSDIINGNDSEGLVAVAVQSTGRPFDAGTMKYTVVSIEPH